ncbi:MAG: protein-L-isoaspartate(D-aspartate) O-methyltransferase [Alphaproteobacteria bacterium]|nr:protein-L-isoaspartate(D-aspartate) O-methyltransferase [Alphaproteobacteria bacterium]MBF0354181.1 protein-L-isoaspartate(D-aspartate) O-methyltransferase [Alphaproteobacteria bacterium]
MTVASRKIRLLMELRAGGVIDTRVLSAIELTPREQFVEQNFLDQAYDNNALPIGCGQTISQPLVVGLMTQALQLGDRMKVLEIGTGSGYQTAILAKLARRVYTIERHRPLLKQAEARFLELRLHNITSLCADGFKGWPEQAPFDRIILTAAPFDVPKTLLDQLDVGGILVAPLGDENGEQHLVKYTRTEQDFEIESLFGVRFVPLLPGVPDAK